MICVGGIPHYLVVDQKGKVHSYTIGYNEPLHQKLRKSVEDLLKTAEEKNAADDKSAAAKPKKKKKEGC